MRKLVLFLALGMFIFASSANACDGDKAMAKKHDCCSTKAKHAKECMTKDGKDCTKDPKCMKDMKASKSRKKIKQQQG